MVDETTDPLRAEIRRLPKAELHAHLSGSVSYEMLTRLSRTNSQRYKLDAWFLNDFRAFTPNLKQIFDAFEPAQEILCDEESVKVAVEDVVGSYASENVRYLELRTTPKELPGFTAQQYVQTIVNAVNHCERQYDIQCKVLLSINTRHSPEESSKVVSMAASDSSGYIVGVDLSGPPATDLNIASTANALRSAQSMGLKVSAHLCEVDQSKDENCFTLAENLIVQNLVDRIAHGTHLWSNLPLASQVAEKKIPIEEGSFKNCADLHFGKFFAIGHPVVVCCDDRGLFKCSINEELYRVATDCKLSIKDVEKLCATSFDCAFDFDQ
ncbi:N6-Methyl-AMP deaminase-like isoform X2 [Convolutriloba macropyga]|uniref:N6-Methyl-AMP deaminase-like isoform X2 n=1 Tax=Convolutriloba macropyga TaxID=536237 RepID=UPI003F527B34